MSESAINDQLIYVVQRDETVCTWLKDRLGDTDIEVRSFSSVDEIDGSDPAPWMILANGDHQAGRHLSELADR